MGQIGPITVSNLNFEHFRSFYLTPKTKPIYHELVYLNVNNAKNVFWFIYLKSWNNMIKYIIVHFDPILGGHPALPQARLMPKIVLCWGSPNSAGWFSHQL